MSDFVCPEGVRLIPIGGKRGAGKFALVDEADYHRLSQFLWHVKPAGYAYRAVRVPGQPQSNVYMHREVMGAVRGQIVDHIDRNTLNNSRSNLRFCTPGENSLNRSAAPSPGGFIGVHPTPRGRFQARFQQEYLGEYLTATDAALARDAAARERGGEFAVLNFPEVFDYAGLQRTRVGTGRGQSGSGFRGVHGRRGRYEVRFRGKYGGAFSTALEAAHAYDALARAAGYEFLANFPALPSDGDGELWPAPLLD